MSDPRAPGATATIYSRYAPKVLRVVSRGFSVSGVGGHPAGLVWVRPEDQADVVQEVFVKALAPRARARYDPTRDYEPYLLMITRNTMIDWVRQRSAFGRLRQATSVVSGALTPGLAPPPWQDERNVSAAEQYVRGLQGQLREVYRLRYTEDRSQEQAAREIGTSRQRLRTLERRLREGLAEVLQEPGWRSSNQNWSRCADKGPGRLAIR
jgi:RNA polymerase sigma factor (sigma-70 family)